MSDKGKGVPGRVWRREGRPWHPSRHSVSPTRTLDTVWDAPFIGREEPSMDGEEPSIGERAIY